MEGYSQEFEKLSLPSSGKGSPIPKEKKPRFVGGISQLSPKKNSPSVKLSPTRSPNKISWLRASDEDLLGRLRNIPKEAQNEQDQYGDCVSGIVQILQDKLQKLLEEKLELKKARRTQEEELRSLNEDSAKAKSELYTADKFLVKTDNSSAKVMEEILKLNGKIQDVVGQLESLRLHGAKITADEETKLKTSEMYFEQLSYAAQQASKNEQDVVEALEREEKSMSDKLRAKTEECESLNAKIVACYDKESDRQYSFKNVSGTIEGSKSSKILK